MSDLNLNTGVTANCAPAVTEKPIMPLAEIIDRAQAFQTSIAAGRTTYAKVRNTLLGCVRSGFCTRSEAIQLLDFIQRK